MHACIDFFYSFVRATVSNGDRYTQAMALLESPAKYPGLPARDRSLVQLRIWRYPSFQPSSSWAVLRAAKALFLRRITWDHRRPVIAEPNTYGSEVPLDAAVFEGLLHRLQAIDLPPFLPVSTVGIDGTSYGVEVGSFGLSARLSWWESAPKAWSLLEEWHASAITQFEGLLPASTPSLGRG